MIMDQLCDIRHGRKNNIGADGTSREGGNQESWVEKRLLM